MFGLGLIVVLPLLELSILVLFVSCFSQFQELGAHSGTVGKPDVPRTTQSYKTCTSVWCKPRHAHVWVDTGWFSVPLRPEWTTNDLSGALPLPIDRTQRHFAKAHNVRINYQWCWFTIWDLRQLSKSQEFTLDQGRADFVAKSVPPCLEREKHC